MVEWDIVLGGGWPVAIGHTRCERRGGSTLQVMFAGAGIVVEVTSLPDAGASDPVVGLAGKAPVADRGVQGHGLAVKMSLQSVGVSGVTTSWPHPQQHLYAAVA